MIDNWPPAKGPKPKHMNVNIAYQDVAAKRSDFQFKLPESFRLERREMLLAIMERKADQKHTEKIFNSVLPNGADELLGESVKVGELLSLAHHVDTVAGLKLTQASRMIFGASKDAATISEMRPRRVKVRITYPLSKGVLLEVRPFIPILRGEGGASARRPRRMTVGHVLWTVAQEYRRIYADWKQYGVWGHALEDLYFEAMVLRRGGVVELQVGSR